MEHHALNESTLYSNEEFKRVIILYQKLLNFLLRELPTLEKDLNVKNIYTIVDVKRWLKDWSKQVFWDYLAATHGSVENLLANQFDKDSTYRCIKIIFASGESIILINNPKFKLNKASNDLEIVEIPEGVLCLDNYRHKLLKPKYDKFYDLYLLLNQFEKKHFLKHHYVETIWKLFASKQESIVDLYKSKLALALNFEYK